MNGNTKQFRLLLITVIFMFVLSGCSVFVSTPRVTRIQMQGVDDQLWEYIVTLDNPADEDLGIQISDRYALQLDFEWLWNRESQADIYYDLNQESAEPTPAPWMLWKYNF